MSGALPSVILVGGAVYVLSEQAPPTRLPPVYTGGNSNYWAPPYDPMGLATQAPDGAAGKVDALMSAAFAKFDAMSDDERRVAAAAMNEKLDLDPPLTGNETWQQVASIAGGAGGTVLCNLIPGIGTLASPLCAIAGSYLGVTLESWIASSEDDIKAWMREHVPNAVTGALDSIGDWVKSLF